jgi:homoserine kinase
LFFALVTPNITVPTIEARAALPESVTLKQMVHQTGAVAELVDAIYRGDVWVMAQMMTDDKVVEPARRHLMPYMDEVRTAAKRAGAMGLVISGAGPTLCAICDDQEIARKVANAMQAVYTVRDMTCLIRHAPVLKGGARVLSVNPA